MAEDPPVSPSGQNAGVHPAPAPLPDVAEPLNTPPATAAPILDLEEVLGAEVVEGEEEPKRGIIDIFEDKAGEWRFRVKGGNGEIVAQSEGYVSQDGAARGFATLKAILAGTLTYKINGKTDDGTE